MVLDNNCCLFIQIFYLNAYPWQFLNKFSLKKLKSYKIQLNSNSMMAIFMFDWILNVDSDA